MKQLINNTPIHSKRTKYYFSNDPWALKWILIGMLFGIGVSLGFYLYWNIVILLFSAIILIVMLFYLILSIYTLVGINKSELTYYGLRRKNTMLWDDILCSGYFHHYVYIDKKAKYYYFSRKPIHWKTDPLGLKNMPARSNNLIIVADQRDLEQVLREYYPKVFS